MEGRDGPRSPRGHVVWAVPLVALLGTATVLFFSGWDRPDIVSWIIHMDTESGSTIPDISAARVPVYSDCNGRPRSRFGSRACTDNLEARVYPQSRVRNVTSSLCDTSHNTCISYSGPYDDTSDINRGVTLRNVMIHGGSLHCYGEQHCASLILPDHPEFNAGTFQLQVVKHTEALDIQAVCDRYVDGTSYLHSMWVIFNNHHVHNDNLLPLFYSLLYRHSRGLQRLFLRNSANLNNPHAQAHVDVMFRMFDSVEPFESLFSLSAPLAHDTWLARANRTAPLARTRFRLGNRTAADVNVCFDELRWMGVPPRLAYRPVPGPYGNEKIAEYRSFVCRLFGLRCRTSPNPRPVQVIYMTRPHKGTRYMHPASIHRLGQAFTAAGMNFTTCCDFASESVGDIITRVNGADVLIGLWGSNLAHALYLPRGAVLVDLLDQAAITGDGLGAGPCSIFPAYGAATELIYVPVVMGTAGTCAPRAVNTILATGLVAHIQQVYTLSPSARLKKSMPYAAAPSYFATPCTPDLWAGFLADASKGGVVSNNTQYVGDLGEGRCEGSIT